MATEPEREERIRELKAELAVLSRSTSKDSGQRVALIIREIVKLSAPKPS